MTATPPSPKSSPLIWFIVATAFFMENLDGTVIATALPQIALTFGTNAVNLSIGMTSYLVALTVFIPVSGWVADRLGTRTVFGGAVAAFTVASILCALSTSVATFTAARILQGMAGAMMVPVGRLAVLRNTSKADLVRAMAFIVWPGLVAPVIGPPVGGFIATYLSWQWIFILNVPLGLAGVFLIRAYIPNTLSRERQPLDVTGFVLSAASLSAFMISVELLGRDGRWETGAVLLAGSLAGMAALVAHLRRHPYPLLDLAVMRVASFTIVMLGGTVARTAISAMPFLLPLLFQVGFGRTAFESGMLYLASMLGNLGMKMMTTQALRRFGFRTVLIGNGVIAAASIALCAVLSADTSVVLVVLILLVHGMSRSMQFSALTSMAFAEVPPAQVSTANTLFSTSQQMSLGLGIAFGAMILHISAAARGNAAGHYGVPDFRIAFAATALLMLLAVWRFLHLRHDAGNEVSGHRAAGKTA